LRGNFFKKDQKTELKKFQVERKSMDMVKLFAKTRNVFGRKGIGKLAMLSISEKVIILSKKDGQEITGGKIINPELDKKIKEKGEYSLENLLDSEKGELFSK